MNEIEYLPATIGLSQSALAALGNEERSFGKASDLYEAAKSDGEGGSGAPGHETRDEVVVFDECLTLKQALDAMEFSVKSHELHPSNTMLALILNCEYQIFRLYGETPIRQNPFLSHWAEVISSCETVIGDLSKKQGKRVANQKVSSRTWMELCEARLEIVKQILQANGHKDLSEGAPISILQKSVEAPCIDFSVTPFIQMLEDEGVYERTIASTGSLEPIPQLDGADVKSASNIMPSPDAENEEQSENQHNLHEKDNMMLEDDRNIRDSIINMPLDLPSLEHINKVLENGSLAKSSSDPTAIVREYVQHCLRMIEGCDNVAANENRRSLSRDSSTNSAASHASFDTSSSIYGEESTPTTSHENGFYPTNPSCNRHERFDYSRDREGQSRAIRLLVLFITNLVRKGYVDPQQLYYEVQELCIRYIWVREVRDFREFLYEGVSA